MIPKYENAQLDRRETTTPKKVRFQKDNRVDDMDTNGDSKDIVLARMKKNEYISSLFPNSASPIENVSLDGSDSDNFMENMPLPPFSPGMPGLISPLPRKPNKGVTPPRPPHMPIP